MDILSFLLGFTKGKMQGESADAVLDEVDAYLDNINGGNVCLVTFVGASGKTIGTVTVPAGTDCPDPIETGLISKPTKPSTTYFAYEFVGWSKYENGAYDGDALKNITESRTLYVVMQAIRIRGSLGGTSYWVASNDRTTIDIYGNGNLERISGEIWEMTSVSYDGVAPAVANTVTTVIFHNTDGVITSIGNNLFTFCLRLANIEIPTTVTSIGIGAFGMCDFKSITIPASVKSIGYQAFSSCNGLTSATFEVTSGWKGRHYDGGATIDISANVNLSDTSSADEALTVTYVNYTWTRG